VRAVHLAILGSWSLIGQGHCSTSLGLVAEQNACRILAAKFFCKALRYAISVVRLNYMVRWIQSKNTTIKYG